MQSSVADHIAGRPKKTPQVRSFGLGFWGARQWCFAQFKLSIMNKKEVLFEIIRREESDRLLAITRDDTAELIGINFFQGVDSGIDVFTIADSNDDLLRFVKCGLFTFDKKSDDLDFIDNLCTMFFQVKISGGV